ncbi:MAG: cation-translocating P-type ATPase [Candidatus Marinimicrobia bacterium]|nr:cation-translocating P-type ATPase [Candidatus Neomarinimicrobiota bacterium]
MKHQTELNIDGMHCSGCVSTVEKALTKVAKVEKAVVNLELEKAVVTGKANSDQLIEAVKSSGYTASLFIRENLSQDSNLKKLEKAKKRMIIGWGATIPIMAWMAIVMFTGKTFSSPEAYHAGMIILSAVTVFYAGGETIRNGWKSLVYFSPNMDVLITIGCLAAWSTGWIRLWIDVQPFTGIAGMIMAFHLTGRYIESKARGNASSAIKKLMNLGAKEATVVNDSGVESVVDIRDISIGDMVVVRAGETISADGIVLDGKADVDESIVTGESIPVAKGVGDFVVGGAVCLDSTLKIRVEKTGQDTFLSQVIRLVENAQTTKVPIQLFADKVVSVFVPIILVLSGITFLSWYFLSGYMLNVSTIVSGILPFFPFDSTPIAQALYASIAVLVIACPCALGLATPTALMAGTGLGAKNGVLIRDGVAVQKMTEADIIFFDKTGTVTEGKLEVVNVCTNSKASKKELIQLTASLEKESSHPLAKALVHYAVEQNIEMLQPEKIQVRPGMGIEGIIRGKKIKVGTPDFTGFKTNINGRKTAVYVSKDDEEIGYFQFRDRLRQDAKELILLLKSKELTPVLLTGDRKGIAGDTARDLGISKVHAELTPELKLEIISNYQNENHVVVMVGDGINDAPGLSQADVGIAMGTGTDIALESGDMVLMGQGMGGIQKAFALSQVVFKKIKQNIFWAFAYNVIAIPLAILGLLHPVIAEIAMAFSSINVVLNSSRLTKSPLT